MSGLVLAFSRLTVKNAVQKPQLARNITTSNTNWFKVSSCLLAEPLKKKKRIDPQVIKAREDRKRKKLEKMIRRLERNARQLKPLDELEVPLNLVDEKQKRLRPVTLPVEELERRVLLEKAWTKYKHQQHLADMQMIDRICASQQKALDELRKESEELYQEAIQIDARLLPFIARGPVSTPPIINYDSPDGDYNDITKKWNQ
ncbi:mitochondrial ribosomal protein L40 [Carabus blaptoides fortunei]